MPSCLYRQPKHSISIDTFRRVIHRRLACCTYATLVNASSTTQYSCKTILSNNTPSPRVLSPVEHTSFCLPLAGDCAQLTDSISVARAACQRRSVTKAALFQTATLFIVDLMVSKPVKFTLAQPKAFLSFSPRCFLLEA
jgi:hypothetical protein